MKSTEKNQRNNLSPERAEKITIMSSYRQILYHLVFRTKESRKTISQQYSRELYAYIMGIIRNKNCFLYRINGMEDHLHILCDLHPSIALADFMRDLKTSSSIWVKQSGKFNKFTGWADGYAALTYGWRDKEKIAIAIAISTMRNAHGYSDKTLSEFELRSVFLYRRIKSAD